MVEEASDKVNQRQDIVSYEEQNMHKIPDDFLSGLIGMSEEDAKKAIEAARYILRLTARDGKYFVVTCDHKANRVNIQTFGGKVISAKVG